MSAIEGERKLDQIASLATALLMAVQPWELQPPEVRAAAVRLTVALAALPVSPCSCGGIQASEYHEDHRPDCTIWGDADAPTPEQEGESE